MKLTNFFEGIDSDYFEGCSVIGLEFWVKEAIGMNTSKLIINVKQIIKKVHRMGGICLAFITWKINRFGDRPHNNKEYNKEYFDNHAKQIEEIETFLEDELSRETYRKLLRYRETHELKYQPFYNKKNQYFPEDIISLSDKEVFIDCGAYDGDTIKQFKRRSNNTYKKIVAFEPSEKNLMKIKQRDKNLFIVNKAVWDKNELVSFQEKGDGSSISEGGEENEKVQCCRLDDCLECQDATFIKMDVEGAEQKALVGAEKIIEKNHPTLAICIYHQPEDMVQIPLSIKRKYPFYKIYIRHHSHRCAETVMYAVSKEQNNSAESK